MNKKAKALASVLLGVTALLGGFGTASATSTPGDDPVLPPKTMTANGKKYYIQSASEATGGGGVVVCGPYEGDPTDSVFLCVNKDTQIGFAGVINTERVGAGAYHFERGTRFEAELQEKSEISSLKTQRNLLAANHVVLLLIIVAGSFLLRGLHKKNKILEKKAKAYDQLQELAEGLKTHYPLSPGE
jgi:hypothetical protein|nr:MAG TPA: hypothetical protein [Caudoviricetes sp.]